MGKYVTTMGDSLLSPPLAVKTPYNKTDLDEFRDSLGLEEMKEELKEFAEGEDEKLENLLKEYVDIEGEIFEKRVRSAHMGITLRGSNAGPDRGHVFYQGRPICGDDSANT